MWIAFIYLYKLLHLRGCYTCQDTKMNNRYWPTLISATIMTDKSAMKNNNSQLIIVVELEHRCNT